MCVWVVGRGRGRAGAAHRADAGGVAVLAVRDGLVELVRLVAPDGLRAGAAAEAGPRGASVRGGRGGGSFRARFGCLPHKAHLVVAGGPEALVAHDDAPDDIRVRADLLQELDLLQSSARGRRAPRPIPSAPRRRRGERGGDGGVMWARARALHSAPCPPVFRAPASAFVI